MKPFAESCEQNRDPILEVLRIELADKSRLLEIGSGTGQHAVYFAPEFPRLLWQTSDVADMHAGIQAWLDEARLANVLPPLALDVCTDHWPHCRLRCHLQCQYRAHHELVASGMFYPRRRAACCRPAACLCLYGPFNYEGQLHQRE